MPRRKSIVKNRIIAGVLTTTLAASILGGVIYFNGNEAYARPTLRGIEELVETHSTGSADTNARPFTILEVVPSLGDAKMGYLVGGEEPVYEGKSIKDMPSKDERTTRFDDASYDPTGLDIYGSAFSWATDEYRYKEPVPTEDEESKRTVEIRGDFVETENGFYAVSDLSSDYTEYTGDVTELYDDGNTEEIVLYRKTEAYRIGAGYNDGFYFNLKQLTDGSEMPIETSTGVYNFQYFTASEVNEETDFGEGVVLFYYDSSASAEYLNFAGIVELEGENLVLRLADGTAQGLGTGSGEVFDPASSNAYVSVQEASEITADVYAIDTVISGGPFGVKQGYSKVEGEVYTTTNAPVGKGPYYVVAGESDEYEFRIGQDGNYNFVADYSKTDIYQNVEYMGGFTNSEWFKREVLDREPGAECDNLVIDVVPVTLDELAGKLDSADLVYFAGGYTGTDIDPELARKVVNKVVNDDLPVIIEYSTLSGAVANDQLNLQKMSLCLMQVALRQIADADAWTALNATDPDAAAYLWKTVRFYNTDAAKMDAVANDISYVSGTIFVNDDIYDTTGKKVVADDFNDTYPKAKRESGFQDIADEYEAEKTYIELYGDWSKFNANISKATSIRYILNKHKNRSVIKSELNILDIEPYATSQYKDQKVLEENIYNNAGVNYSGRYALTRDTMTSDWMITNLTPHLKDKADNIHIVQQGTKEFIGKNEDLNSTYDMIYIGMDTAIMNTAKVDNKKSTNPVYNFVWNNLKLYNNKIYVHVGDRIYDIFDPDYYGPVHESYRNLSGNDITSDKYRELKEYIEAGYAVVLSDSFFKVSGSSVTLNSDTIDTTSNLYKLLDKVALEKDGSGVYKYYGKSVFRKGELEKESVNCERARSTISKYLNISKLTIKAQEVPPEYKGVENPNYIPTNSDGSHTMKFVVELTNDAAVDASKTTYDCKLYLDMDADGKFEEAEALGGIMVDGESSDKFELKSGNTYTITRNTPDNYVGFLSWKLAFVQNERETSSEATALNNVRSSITGYSAIRNEGERPTIKILQIAPNDGQPLNLDLTSADMNNNYYSKVTDFNITVDKVTVADYIQKKYADTKVRAGNLTYYDFLAQYDMVVMGFTDAFAFEANRNGDLVEVSYPVWWTTRYNNGANPQYNYQDVYKDAMLGIREYALSGRSILFTHDLTSRFVWNETSIGYFANLYLRDIMGMDRFGYLDMSDMNYVNDYEIALEEYATTMTRDGLKAKSREYKLANYVSEYDYNLMDNNAALTGKSNSGDFASEDKDNLGLTDSTVITFADKTGSHKLGWGLTTRKSTYDFYARNTPKEDNKRETVTAVNEGQITRYPFFITEGTSGEGDRSSFDVSSTHSQWFQLNLDTDSRDTNMNDDVVVWYTISNNGSTGSQYTSPYHEYYQAVYDDVRNNYYIYSKGNVTYTGAGHSSIVSEEEKKLFVNTLVASYNSGLHAPKVVFKENPWDSAVNITSTCLPYDPKLTNNEALTDTDAVAADEGGFIGDTLKVNFKTLNNNFRDSGASLYVEYYLMDTNGETVIDDVNYKRLYPSVKIDNGNGTLSPVDAGTLANYRVYQATFNLADLNLSSGNKLTKENSRIYVRISTVPYTGSNKSTANESMNPLDITAMKLFDLK